MVRNRVRVRVSGMFRLRLRVGDSRTRILKFGNPGSQYCIHDVRRNTYSWFSRLRCFRVFPFILLKSLKKFEQNLLRDLTSSALQISIVSQAKRV